MSYHWNNVAWTIKRRRTGVVIKNFVEFFEKNCKLKFHFFICRRCPSFITLHTLYIDMEKNLKFSEFVNVLKVFNKNLDNVDEFFFAKVHLCSLIKMAALQSKNVSYLFDLSIIHCYHSINQWYYLWIAWCRYVFLLPTVVHRQSSLDFLVYLVRPFRAFRALHMIYWLKSENQYLKKGTYRACLLSELNGNYRASVVITYITICIRQLL